MAWYDNSDKKSDVILSSRVRLARNLKGYPFGAHLDWEKSAEIVEKVGSLLQKSGFETIDFSEISPYEAASLYEKHYVSRDFLKKTSPHVLMQNETCGLSVMVCEEDHLRIQCILPGLSLDEAFKNACAVDDLVDSELPIAYSEELGYLTHCPTNLGTALRASVMIFLPALTMAGRIQSLANRLSQIGLTVRGFYGEGTEAKGAIYQISNQITLGITEEETLKRLSDAIAKISQSEHELRALITPEKNPQIIDRICRAEGILRHAYLLSSDEFLAHYADLRLGVALGTITTTNYERLDRLLVEVLPHSLALSEGKTTLDEHERDLLRARRVQKIL